MTKTLISIDLDWFNDRDRPITALRNLLRHIPRNIPAIMTVEHHEFLPQLRRWIKLGKVSTPFNILNIDEHHDYYRNSPPHDPDGTEINCANWGYRIPLDWYNRYTWVHNSNGGYLDWEQAQRWLNGYNITFSSRCKPRLSELKTDIVAAIFCVSPDYLGYEMHSYISKATEIIAHHFGLRKAPLKITSGNIGRVDGWRMAPRPTKALAN